MNDYATGVLDAAKETAKHTVLAREVAPSRITAAQFGAKRAAERAGVRTVPEIRFFRKTAATLDVLGSSAVPGDTIWLRNDLDLPTTAEYASHEATHAFGCHVESKCYDAGSEVRRDWIQHRLDKLPTLMKRMSEIRETFLSMPSGAKRAELLCISLGISIHAKASRLVIEELDLREAEIAFLEKRAYDSPTAHLRVPASPPPPATYSFDRTIR